MKIAVPVTPANLAFAFAMILVLIFQGTPAKPQCCPYTLSMHDSYGDGWNGGNVEVFANHVSLGNFSATGFGSTGTFRVCNGDTLELFYSAGSYENENTYQLYDSTWNLVFADGPNPQTGNVFSAAGNYSGLVIPGSNPCTALPVDTGQYLVVDNTGFPGSGINPGCAGWQGRDVWLTLLVPPSGCLSVETDSGTLTDTGIAVWTDTTCTSLRMIGCDDDSGNGYYSFLLLYDLPPGQTIYLQAWGYGGGTGSFRVLVNDLGTVVLDSTELPIVMINTLGQTIVPDLKVNCLMDIKYNGPGSITHVTDSANIYSGHIGIEIRGATSASYPQPAYGVETRDSTGANHSVPILGMPAENDWVLLSNFNDRALIRNTLAYKLFGDMGNYTPRAGLCEVLIDSSYRGIYVLGEKIKRDKNRVDISELTPADTTGNDLTGGYILQQNYWDPSNSFQSNYSPIDHPGLDVHFLYEYPKPDTILPVQKYYIASFVDSLEDALYSPGFADTVSGYRKYMDVKSFIDYFLVNEVSRNADGFKKSVFYNKPKFSKGGKLKAGPVWDFDWAWKNLGNCDIFANFDGAGWAHHVNDCPSDNHSTGWYVRLFQDSTFNDELRCTYESYRQSILDTTYIFAYIDGVRSLVQHAQARHFKKWPVLGVSGPAPEIGAIAATYNAELDTLKKWITIRLQWLDANIPGLCVPVGVAGADPPGAVHCFPNPAGDFVQVNYSLPAPVMVKVSILNYLGQEVVSRDEGTQPAGKHSIQLETSGLPAGLYVVHLETGSSFTSGKLVVVK